MQKTTNGLSLFPTVAAFIAFILGVLCLFSGTKTNFLTGNNILTVRSPRPVHIHVYTIISAQKCVLTGPAPYTHRQ